MISGHGDRALVAKALEVGASDFIAKPIERDVFIRTVRQTLNVSRLRRLLERQHTLISRARDHYVGIVDKVGHSNEQWIGSLENMLRDSGIPPADVRMRQARAEQQMHVLNQRTTRHLAILDAFLVKATHAHRQTSEELNVAQETLRRLASTRLNVRY